jgi:hypothetical protein
MIDEDSQQHHRQRLSQLTPTYLAFNRFDGEDRETPIS